MRWNAGRGDPLTDFDHLLAPAALKALTNRLTALPTTHGWAMNQTCDGAARVAIEVSADTAVWTAIAVPDLPTGHALAQLIGAHIWP